MNWCNVYLDCDEVLLQTAQTHALFLQQEYNIIVDKNTYPSHWDFPESSGLDFNKSTELFTQTHYFKEVPAVSGAKTAIQKLKNTGASLSVISSISTNSVARNNRLQNLRNVFGDVFYDIILLPLGWANKLIQYKKLPKGIVIDDSIFNIQDAISCGHDAVFISLLQNKEHIAIARDLLIPTANSLLEYVDNHMIKQR